MQTYSQKQPLTDFKHDGGAVYATSESISKFDEPNHYLKNLILQQHRVQ
jgi:hypothetical protein